MNKNIASIIVTRKAKLKAPMNGKDNQDRFSLHVPIKMSVFSRLLTYENVVYFFV